VLSSLSIKNYALIDNLHVNFGDGLTILTGETGAGKSILLGGLSLILGKRADLGSLKNKEVKCVIEANFYIEKYQLESFFEEANLDYDVSTIIRREILPSGKSRAFINDTPVTLDVLTRLGERLIDIHSQHQTLQLTENYFQFKIIDAVAKVDTHLHEYQTKRIDYLEAKKKLQHLIDFQSEADKEHDYNTFLLKELEEASLEIGMLESLETTYETLNNIEVIGERLTLANQLLSEEQIGILANLNTLKNTLQKLSEFGEQFHELYTRTNSVVIELDDLFSEIQDQEEKLEADPQLLEKVNMKLQTIYNLQKKHNVLGIEALIEIKKNLLEKVAVTENIESTIQQQELNVLNLEKELNTIANDIHNKRKETIPDLITYLEKSLTDLGMPNARFNISVQQTNSYLSNGKDELQFLFSANKGGSYGILKKVASGGELSRIMLSIKAILIEYIQLPSIMFDEIDAGVSGEISNKMGDIMAKMSNKMQVFAITHLPQVAAKGNKHFKVFKEDVNEITTTSIRELNEEERINEIAEMLSGKAISTSALAHAKQLLN